MGEGSLHVRLTPSVFFDFSGRAVDWARLEGWDSRAFAIDGEAGSDRKGRPIPWWVENLVDDGSPFPVSHIPSVSLDRSREGVEVSKPDGAEYEIVLPRGWIARLKEKGLDLDYLFGAGDIIEDRDGGVLAYIVEPTFPTIADDVGVKLRVRQLTSVRTPDFGKNWEIERAIVADKGDLVFHNARRFYPFARRTLLETQKGRAEAHLSPREVPARESDDTLFVQVGDHIASSRLGAAPNERLFQRGRVSGIDQHSRTITIDSPAERDFWGECTVFVKGSAR